MVFLDNLHRTPYGQFYANEINIINADATKVPRSVGDIYQKAKAYVVIATTTKPNGNPVSFATTADSFLRSNKKKTQGPRGQQSNNPNNGLYVSKGSQAPTIPPNVSAVPDPVAAPTSNTTTTTTSAAESPTTNHHTPRNMSRVQCFHRQDFGHFVRDCPNREAINGMTMDDGDGVYYQPKWYEVGLDTMSQVNVMNSRFLVDFTPCEGGFKGLASQKGKKTSYTGTLPLIPQLKCIVCDDCVASVLSQGQVEKAGIKISYNDEEGYYILHTKNGNIKFVLKGDLYIADFRSHLTNRAISAMTTRESERNCLRRR